MTNRLHQRLLIPYLLIVLLPGCQPDTQQATKPTQQGVLLTSPALLEIASALLEQQESTRLVIPDVVTSRTWRPTRSAIEKLQRGKLLLLSGADWEPWLQQVSLPQSRIRDVSDTFAHRLIHLPDVETHRHGGGGLHSHAGFVSHLWLSPAMLQQQLEATAQIIGRDFPELKNQLQSRSSGLKQQLLQLSADVDRIRDLAETTSPVLITDGPEYEYLLRDLGWSAQRLHWPRGEEPTADDWLELQQILEQLPADNIQVPLVLIHDQRAADTQVALKQKGCRIAQIDLCEKQQSQKSVPERLRENLRRIEQALQ